MGKNNYPKSRINIKYNTVVEGKPVDKSLPMKFLVIGDLSGGVSKDRAVDLDERELRDVKGTLDSTINDMNISVDVQTENYINPAKNPMLNVSIPIKSMKSFRPENIAQNIPELRGLMKMRELLKEFESTIDNNKAFRNAIKNIMRDKEMVQKLVKDLPNLDSFKLEQQGNEE